MEKLPSRPLLLDGATGTRLLAAGMPWGVCPEAWVLEHPEVVRAIQRSYVEAGSEVLYAPTFGANPIRLAAFGLEGQMERMNRDLVSLAREASGGQALVAGDISTAGELPEPFGELTYRDLVACYAVQAGALRDAGADLLVCETFTSLLDARAALLGARTAGLPVLVSVTADEFGRTMMGSETLACLIVMQSLGAAAFGLNCGDGPEKMEFPIRELAAHAKIPVIASRTPESHPASRRAILSRRSSSPPGCRCCSTRARPWSAAAAGRTSAISRCSAGFWIAACVSAKRPRPPAGKSRLSMDEFQPPAGKSRLPMSELRSLVGNPKSPAGNPQSPTNKFRPSTEKPQSPANNLWPPVGRAQSRMGKSRFPADNSRSPMSEFRSPTGGAPIFSARGSAFQRRSRVGRTWETRCSTPRGSRATPR